MDSARKISRQLVTKQRMNEVLGGFRYEPTADPVEKMADFYALNGLSGLMLATLDRQADNPQTYRQRDEDVIQAIRYAEDRITRKMAEDLITGGLFSITSELRHANDAAPVYEQAELADLDESEYVMFHGFMALMNNDEALLDMDLPEILSGAEYSKEIAYRAAYTVARFNEETIEDFVMMAEKVFRHGDWARNFGGEAWARGCDAWLDISYAYKNWERSPTPAMKQKLVDAVDHMWDLEHNTGVFLNKVPGFNKQGYNWIPKVLDFKREVQDLNDFRAFVSGPVEKLIGYAQAAAGFETAEQWETHNVKALAGQLPERVVPVWPLKYTTSTFMERVIVPVARWLDDWITENEASENDQRISMSPITSRDVGFHLGTREENPFPNLDAFFKNMDQSEFEHWREVVGLSPTIRAFYPTNRALILTNRGEDDKTYEALKNKELPNWGLVKSEPVQNNIGTQVGENEFVADPASVGVMSGNVTMTSIDDGAETGLAKAVTSPLYTLAVMAGYDGHVSITAYPDSVELTLMELMTNPGAADQVASELKTSLEDYSKRELFGEFEDVKVYWIDGDATIVAAMPSVAPPAGETWVSLTETITEMLIETVPEHWGLSREEYIVTHPDVAEWSGVNPNTEPVVLGEGANGVAFGFGDKVIKITKDDDEATASANIQGYGLRNVGIIHKVAYLPDQGLYLIVQERYEGLGITERQAVEAFASVWSSIIMQYGDADEILENERPFEMFWEFVERAGTRRGRGWRDLWTTLNAGEVGRIYRDVFEGLLTGLLSLREHGISYSDIHEGNVLKDGEDYVIIDLGLSHSRNPYPPMDQIYIEEL